MASRKTNRQMRDDGKHEMVTEYIDIDKDAVKTT